MDWNSLGFKENPFKTDPILEDTLNLFVGHEENELLKKHDFYQKKYQTLSPLLELMRLEPALIMVKTG